MDDIFSQRLPLCKRSVAIFSEVLTFSMVQKQLSYFEPMQRNYTTDQDGDQSGNRGNPIARQNIHEKEKQYKYDRGYKCPQNEPN
jgi:hypothetical protein